MKTTPDRLNALSDGVIAIALTLLVLGIDIPDDHKFSEEGLFAFLLKLKSGFVAYIASFLIIGIYWILHHNIFKELNFINGAIIGLNMVFLFSISLVPFIAKLKTLYSEESLIMLIYAASHLLTGLILFAIWVYATKKPGLLADEMDQHQKKTVSLKILIIPFLAIVAVVLSLLNVPISAYTFLFIPLVYLFVLKEK